MTCQITVNNELLINEAHNNNWIFVLERIPSSYLISKFMEDTKSPLDGTLGSVVNGGIPYTQEAQNDTANFALYLQSFTLPDLNLQTSPIDTSFATLNAITGKLEFGTLTTNIMCDENWFIYRMLVYWMYAASNPEEFNKLRGRAHYNNFYVGGHLILLDNHHEKILELEYRDLHPQNMGQQEMNYQNAEKLVLPVTWIYSTFTPSDDYVIKKV